MVNCKRLITGGSNYYTPAYLKEDPIHDMSLQVSGEGGRSCNYYPLLLTRTLEVCDLCSIRGTLHNLVRVSI